MMIKVAESKKKKDQSTLSINDQRKSRSIPPKEINRKLWQRHTATTTLSFTKINIFLCIFDVYMILAAERMNMLSWIRNTNTDKCHYKFPINCECMRENKVSCNN